VEFLELKDMPLAGRTKPGSSTMAMDSREPLYPNTPQSRCVDSSILPIKTPPARFASPTSNPQNGMTSIEIYEESQKFKMFALDSLNLRHPILRAQLEMFFRFGNWVLGIWKLKQ
jgi:hypothetical protein